jgi:hypothetical protein
MAASVQARDLDGVLLDHSDDIQMRARVPCPMERLERAAAPRIDL